MKKKKNQTVIEISESTAAHWKCTRNLVVMTIVGTKIKKAPVWLLCHFLWTTWAVLFIMYTCSCVTCWIILCQSVSFIRHHSDLSGLVGLFVFSLPAFGFQSHVIYVVFLKKTTTFHIMWHPDTNFHYFIYLYLPAS